MNVSSGYAAEGTLTESAATARMYGARSLSNADLGNSIGPDAKVAQAEGCDSRLAFKP
jgi:hypothetical protein